MFQSSEEQQTAELCIALQTTNMKYRNLNLIKYTNYECLSLSVIISMIVIDRFSMYAEHKRYTLTHKYS